MNKFFNKVGNGIKTIFNVFCALVGVTLGIAWCVAIVFGSYGAAISAFQWFNSLI